MEGKKSAGEIVTLVLKAIALAMSVAAIVLNVLGVATVETEVLLLSLGLFALAVTALR